MNLMHHPQRPHRQAGQESSSISRPGEDVAVGLDPSVVRQLNDEASHPPAASGSRDPVGISSEILRLRAECDRLEETQRRVMELLKSSSSDQIVHDLRNLLNERDLFKALADVDAGK